MTFAWEAGPVTGWALAAARVDTGVVYYVGLAVVVVIMIGTIIAFYRTWAEIHEDLEPDSPQDLLESFRDAHAAGEIDDRELERVRRLLATAQDETAVAGSTARARGSSPGEVLRSDEGGANSAEPDPTVPLPTEGG